MKFHWIQWGKRNHFIGLKALAKDVPIEAHIAYYKECIKSQRNINVKNYKVPFLLQHANSKIFHDSLDLGSGKFIDLFHRNVLKSISEADCIYTISNGIYTNSNVFRLRIHEQVACTLDLAVLKNKYEKKHFDLDLIREREINNLSLTDLVICPSPYVEAYVRKLVPSAKTRLIRYPLPDVPSHLLIPQSLNCVKYQLRLIFVGRVEFSKGVDLIFSLAKKFNNIEFTLIGDILTDVPSYSNLKCLGRLPLQQVFVHLASSDMFIFPSFSEGSSFATLEAMACLLPGLVSFQSGSHYENNFSGFVLDANSHESWFDKVEYILGAPDCLMYFKENIKKTKKWSHSDYETEMREMLNDC
ncbi:glycosyltransferase family 4 protein [Pseudoalteromonas xiamenensis]